MLTANIRDARIERYYPDVLANAKEFKAMAEVVDPELRALWQALWKQMLNTFVYDIDLDGAARWESMLDIRPDAGATLATRRKEILKRINTALPYTHRTFQNMLDGVYGEGNVQVSLVYNSYELWLNIEAAVLTQGAAIRRYARVIVPANLSVKLSHLIKAEISRYSAAVVSWAHRASIPYSTSVNFDDMPFNRYVGAVAGMSKKITIGGN